MDLATRIEKASQDQGFVKKVGNALRDASLTHELANTNPIAASKAVEIFKRLFEEKELTHK